MINFLDKIYTGIQDRNFFYSRIKVYSIQRLIIRVLSNILIPISYQFGKGKYILDSNDSSGVKYIVSLTSFPNRIGRVWIVIESILRQRHKPDKIILWLSKEQFGSFSDLPRTLRNQQKRGLDIRFVEGDLKSHKKYFYALNQFPNDFLITVDDDIIYPTTLIGDLVKLNSNYPKSIICHRAHRINVENGKVLPYSSWKQIKNFEGPNFDVFFTSGGGTLFPPNSLHQEVLNNRVFKEKSFYADDVWLNIMARLNSTTIVKSNYSSSLLPIFNFRNIDLYSVNLLLEENDKQINAVCDFYFKKLGVDVFK